MDVFKRLGVGKRGGERRFISSVFVGLGLGRSRIVFSQGGGDLMGFGFFQDYRGAVGEDTREGAWIVDSRQQMFIGCRYYFGFIEVIWQWDSVWEGRSGQRFWVGSGFRRQREDLVFFRFLVSRSLCFQDDIVFSLFLGCQLGNTFGFVLIRNKIFSFEKVLFFFLCKVLIRKGFGFASCCGQVRCFRVLSQFEEFFLLVRQG